MEAKTLTSCRKRKNTVGSCGKQKQKRLTMEDHPHLRDEVILPTEDHPNLPDEVILVTEDLPQLPDEVIFEKIMTKVPVLTLMTCGCVSKNWYKSIFHDPHFATAYLTCQPKKDLPFVFYILNVLNDDDDNSSKFPNRNYIFRFKADDAPKAKANPDPIDVLYCDEKFLLESESIRIELVGNCNGLLCLSRSEYGIMIVNPIRDEVLTIFNPPIIKNGGCIVCCYGFGFDSLTHEYKVVLIVRTAAVVKKSEFKCLVFTLGTNSWRETSTTIPSSLTTTTTSFYKSAIFCGGEALFWRTKSISSSSSSHNNMLLLSFHLHDEEFQVIRLPAECAASSLLEQEHQIVDPLFEFKGSPCVARLEKTLLGGGGGGGSYNSTSYCYKVHLHILKEYSKVGRPNEQVWIKKTFDVAPLTWITNISPAAPCFARTSSTPPNRIMSLSDGRVVLYCFGAGQVIQAHDLQTKRLSILNWDEYLVKCYKKIHSEVYDQIDYHLSSGHIVNVMSMLAFIPKGGGGAPPRLDNDELISILDDKQRTLPVVGYLSVRHQKSADIYLL